MLENQGDVYAVRTVWPERPPRDGVLQFVVIDRRSRRRLCFCQPQRRYDDQFRAQEPEYPFGGGKVGECGCICSENRRQRSSIRVQHLLFDRHSGFGGGGEKWKL